MTFAIITTGGKQYKVSLGDKIKVEKLSAPENPGGLRGWLKNGVNLELDKVLLVADGEDVKIGTPYVEGAKVEAKVVKQGRHDKKIVFRYHSKTRYRKKKGHRQHYTELEIVGIK